MKNLQKAARPRGRPKREAAPDPANVLRAALSHFAVHGFAGTTLRSMAETAGVDAALISRQFGSKLELWKAAVDLVSERMAAAQAQIAARENGGCPIEDRLLTALEGFVRFSCNVPELGRFFAEEIKQPGERRDYVLEKIWDKHRYAMLPLLQEADDANVLPVGSDPEFLLLVLVGAVAMPLMMEPVLMTRVEGVEERVDRLLGNIKNLFFR